MYKHWRTWWLWVIWVNNVLAWVDSNDTCKIYAIFWRQISSVVTARPQRILRCWQRRDQRGTRELGLGLGTCVAWTVSRASKENRKCRNISDHAFSFFPCQSRYIWSSLTPDVVGFIIDIHLWVNVHPKCRLATITQHSRYMSWSSANLAARNLFSSWQTLGSRVAGRGEERDIGYEYKYVNGGGVVPLHGPL